MNERYDKKTPTNFNFIKFDIVLNNEVELGMKIREYYKYYF